MVSQQEAKEMRDAIRLLEQTEAQAAQAQQQADLAITIAWFNTLGINIQTATTRTEALANFKQIESLLQTETDQFRLGVLRNKLNEANERFKEIKRIGN